MHYRTDIQQFKGPNTEIQTINLKNQLLLIIIIHRI